MRKMSFLLCVLIVLTTASIASAHERREVGQLELVVGWANEPAFVGELNAVSLRVQRDGAGVEGLGGDLEVAVSLGDASTGKLAMRAVFDDPGHYQADLIPTAPGAYAFHVTGAIDGEELDQIFTAGEDTFDEVHGTSDIAFPQAAPSNAELAAAIDALGPRVEEATSSAEDAASMARLLAIVALVLGGGALATSLVRRRGA